MLHFQLSGPVVDFGQEADFHSDFEEAGNSGDCNKSLELRGMLISQSPYWKMMREFGKCQRVKPSVLLKI